MSTKPPKTIVQPVAKSAQRLHVKKPGERSLPASTRLPSPKQDRASGQLVSVIPHEWEEYIEARAAALKWNKSKFTHHMVRWWMAQGAPSIHPADLPIDPVPAVEDAP